MVGRRWVHGGFRLGCMHSTHRPQTLMHKGFQEKTLGISQKRENSMKQKRMLVGLREFTAWPCSKNCMAM